MDRDYVLAQWWAMALRGMVALAFGVIILAWPAATSLVFLILWALFALFEGMLDIIASIALGKRKKRWDILGTRGLIQMLLAVVILARPDFSFLLLVILIGIWAVSWGFVDIVTAIAMPPRPGRLVIFLVGGISIALGIYFMVWLLQSRQSLLSCVSWAPMRWSWELDSSPCPHL